jgi:3-hydroxymyristoyl/3-hydroxydecanoyl-(acyl carrier protein) dehydratases
MDRSEIRTLLPHREPMLLIDEVELTQDGKAIGKTMIHGDEYFLQGHFPGNPVVPGVILCEMMAQACSLLIPKEKLRGATPYFAGIKDAAFKRRVLPGETVVFSCELVRTMGNFYFCQGEGSVDGTTCVKAQLSFALIREA